MNELVAKHNASLNFERKELTSINKELDKLIQAIIDGVSGASVKDKIDALETRKQVADLIPLLEEEAHRSRAAEIIRDFSRCD